MAILSTQVKALCVQVHQKLFTITVDPVPMVNAIANHNLCSGASSAVIHFSGGIPGTTFNWTNSNTNIGLSANGTGDINPFTVTNSTGAAITAVVTETATY
jgi:large repetitive protein